jgi:hypothetical protein
MTQPSKTPGDSTTKGPTQDGRELESKHPAQQKRDDDASAPLPHETDQSPGSQEESEPRRVGEQAHEDLERGLEDTDRRGGADYQERTQSNGPANSNSRRPK